MGLNITYGTGQTTIDEDEKMDLIPYWVANNSDLNLAEQENINKAMVFYVYKKMKHTDILTIKFVKKLHEKMFSKVWKWAGNFRKTDKNIGICKTQITVSLYGLLENTKYWIEHAIYPLYEACVRCKHGLVSIHPFPNGNGRHARFFADMLLFSLGNGETFTWGQSFANPRDKYLESLRAADMGNFKPLLFFAKN